MEGKKGLLDDNFLFKVKPDSSLDRTKVFCCHCRCEMSYHRSTSSLKYHLLAKHPTLQGSSAQPSRLTKQVKLDGLRQKSMPASTTSKLSTAVAKWIAKACRPVNIVKDEDLREIIRIASNDPTYQLPSRATTVKNIAELYENEKTKITEALGKAETAALTGDYWTSLGNHNYLGVTGHFFDCEWQLRSTALTVMKTEERHFASVLSRLTTDSAHNMIAAARRFPFEHVPCVAHCIHRVITVCLHNSPFDSTLAKCRRLVGHFKHSPANSAELEHKQIAHDQKKESIAQDVTTRWNSTLEMIKRILRNVEPLRDALAQHATNVTMPTPAELDKLKNFPSFTFLDVSVKLLNTSEDDPAYLAKFKENFTAEMESRKPKMNIAWLRMATALNPRFKDLKCLKRHERPEVWRSLTALLGGADSKRTRKPEDEDPQPPTKRAALMLTQESSSDEEQDCTQNCVERYKAEPTIGMEDCPLKWWAEHQGSHNEVARLARKYLATPATSVPCERLFSLSGHIVQKKRASLSSENINRLDRRESGLVRYCVRV
uniref:BED-type domain-containing protein n=1 Tax=Oryzias melastigma TaxID=30732 RepID=A0A3B3DTM8_ORYME